MSPHPDAAVLEHFTVDQLRTHIACREARERLAGEPLADEIARLTAAADVETARAFDEIVQADRCARDIAKMRRVAVSMLLEDGFPAELVITVCSAEVPEAEPAIRAAVGRALAGGCRAA